MTVFADEKIDGKEGFALSKGRKRKGEVNRRRGRYCKEEEEANGGIGK